MSKSTKSVAAKKTTTKSAYLSAYRNGSSYHAIVQAVHNLGFGKFHPIVKIVELIPAIMGKDAFGEFKTRKAREGKEQVSWQGRICTNAQVVCRADKYGQPLRDHGTEMRKQYSKDDGYAFGLFDAEPASKTTTKAIKAPKAKSKPKSAPVKKAAPKATRASKSKSAADAVLEAFGLDLEAGTIRGKKISRIAK